MLVPGVTRCRARTRDHLEKAVPHRGITRVEPGGTCFGCYNKGSTLVTEEMLELYALFFLL